MLLHLNIQNFAIVRSLDIDWNHGMTTITGETGAGKSIAIDALGLCLGERALTNVVRPGCKKAELSAVFGILANPAANNWLKKHDLNADDECILRRVVSAEGRSRAYINGSQVPLAQLKELGQLLINIHGQHDHQQIVKAAEQRRMLDDYAGHQHLMDDVKYHHQQWRQLTAELKQLQENKLQRDAKQQLLQYQISELDEFALQPGEFETLEADYKRYSNSQHLLNETQMSLQLLSDNEEFNVLDSLRRSCDSLSALSNVDNSLSGIAQVLEEAQIQIDDACSDLRQYYDRLELDPETFHYLEERYSQAIQLAKKHQLAPENLPDFHAELARELANISSDESRLSAMGEEIEQARQRYLDAARVLSKSRQKQAKKLSALISTSMQELNMPHGKFQALIEQNPGEQLSVHGIDEVSFLVSINPGQPLEAMNKVASGGELSRISLAMQVILADKVVTPSLIFDEVDVGISGPTAAMVGSKLQQLAKNTQVICVTHLPQVACKGHQQLFVAKLTDGEHTETKVTELSEPARIKEIARLLAGDKITEHSLANAEELLAG
ncbi:DNA repair protein RecN [Thalassomonas viridans]|uniref:DNA repair protein RecN n=1 Tax=Thalassomonas viridans TaxID=137584 RepID=A0AAE9Z021_9GAMM|nr:DNA repair protein RecN [Thalassomonas viridans]WDE03605.1 DNA repair protein RecN [Thalassomonas viridans]